MSESTLSDSRSRRKLALSQWHRSPYWFNLHTTTHRLILLIYFKSTTDRTEGHLYCRRYTKMHKYSYTPDGNLQKEKQTNKQAQCYKLTTTKDARILGVARETLEQGNWKNATEIFVKLLIVFMLIVLQFASPIVNSNRVWSYKHNSRIEILFVIVVVVLVICSSAIRWPKEDYVLVIPSVCLSVRPPKKTLRHCQS